MTTSSIQGTLIKLFFAVLSLLSISFSAYSAPGKSCQVILKGELASGKPITKLVDLKQSWGLQMLEMRLDDILDFTTHLALVKADAKLELFEEYSPRRFFYQTQALSKVYEAHDDEFFKQHRAEFKKAEDVTGRYELQRSLRKRAEKLNIFELKTYFTAREKETKYAMLSEFERWDANKVEGLRSTLKNYRHWPAGKKDAEFLIEQLIEQTLKLERDCKKMKFDQADIELGLHELRRRIRALVLQVMSMNHFVSLAKENKLSKPVAEWFSELEKLDPNFLDNKMMQLSESPLEQPLQIPAQIYGIMTKLVMDLGDRKDLSEMEIYFIDAMKTLEFSDQRIQEVLVKLRASFGMGEIDHQAVARQYQEKLNSSELLGKFAKKLKQMNEEI